MERGWKKTCAGICPLKIADYYVAPNRDYCLANCSISANCGCQLMSPTALEIRDERYLLGCLVGGWLYEILKFTFELVLYPEPSPCCEK